MTKTDSISAKQDAEARYPNALRLAVFSLKSTAGILVALQFVSIYHVEIFGRILPDDVRLTPLILLLICIAIGVDLGRRPTDHSFHPTLCLWLLCIFGTIAVETLHALHI